MEFLRRSCHIMLLMLSAASLSAQSAPARLLSGRVVDASTNEPLPTATIRLVELHRDTRSHTDGLFSFGLIPEGRYQLIVQSLGYSSASRVVELGASTGSIVVALRASPVQLTATVVTGQIGERRALDAISPTNALADAALDRRLSGTVASTLQGSPGVAVASMGPATGKPVLRGLSGDRVLVLEDGMRPGDLSSTSMDHAVAVDPLTARRVEVVRGPMSLLYGSSALGGVVNVIREEIPSSRPDHLHGVISAQGSSVNRGGTVGGSVELPLGQLSLRADLSGRTAGDLRTPAGTLANTGTQTMGTGVGVSLVRDWGYSGLSYRYYGNDYGLPGGFVGAHPGGVDIAMRRQMVRSETDWHVDRGPWESVKATLGFTDYSHEELEGDGDVGTRFQQLMTAAEVVARHERIGPFASGVVGMRGQYRDITTGGSLRTPSTADWSLAGFVVEEAQLGPVRLQGGVRYDVARYIPLEEAVVTVRDEQIPANARTFGSLSGSLGALYQFGEGWRAGVSLSRAYRTPDFNELYSDGPHLAAYSYDVGNPRLDAETGFGVDLFVRVERERFRGELALFRNAMDGYVFPRNTGELGRQGQRWKFQYSNEDALLVGGEFDAEWTVRPHVVVDATVSYVRGTILGPRDSIPGIDGAPGVLESGNLPLMPPLNGRIGLRHDTPKWFAGGGVRLAAAQSQLGDFETTTAGSATFDANIGWRLLFGTRLHTLTFRVENLFDTEVREHLSRTKEIIPEAGRNISLLYRVQF